MLKYNALIFILLLAFSLHSQTTFHFADSGTQWNVLYSHFPSGTPPYLDTSYQTTIYTVGTDTVIGSANYQQIDGYFVRRDSANRIYELGPDYTDYLIYDFSRQTGDTFAIHGSPFYQDSTEVMVVKTDTVVWDKPRKRMTLSLGPSYSISNSFVCVDGVGALQTNFLQPQIFRALCDCYYETLCYFQSNSLIYHDTAFATCDTNNTTVINNVTALNVKVYPTVITGNYVNVQFSQTPLEHTKMDIFDVTGKIIRHKTLNSLLNLVDLGGISNGIYLYSISSGMQKTGGGKIVMNKF